MLDRYGHAGLRLPESDCVSALHLSRASLERKCRANQEDDLGQLYLTNVDFLKNGVPASIIAAFVSRKPASRHV